MNSFFYNISQGQRSKPVALDQSKECALFIPTHSTGDKEIANAKTPEQASAIIGKRMVEALDAEFSRLHLAV